MHASIDTTVTLKGGPFDGRRKAVLLKWSEHSEGYEFPPTIQIAEEPEYFGLPKKRGVVDANKQLRIFTYRRCGDYQYEFIEQA